MNKRNITKKVDLDDFDKKSFLYKWIHDRKYFLKQILKLFWKKFNI